MAITLQMLETINNYAGEEVLGQEDIGKAVYDTSGGRVAVQIPVDPEETNPGDLNVKFIDFTGDVTTFYTDFNDIPSPPTLFKTLDPYKSTVIVAVLAGEQSIERFVTITPEMSLDIDLLRREVGIF